MASSWYVRHSLAWECCKPFKKKQHKDTLGNNIKGLYEHSMWNCWCLACVEAGRLGVLEATIFPALQGNFAYAAKPGIKLHVNDIPIIYIYYILWSDIPMIFQLFHPSPFLKTQKTLGVESAQVSALWDERCAIVGWFCHCFVASVFRKEKHICNYGPKTPSMDVSYKEPHVWFMISLKPLSYGFSMLFQWVFHENRLVKGLTVGWWSPVCIPYHSAMVGPFLPIKKKWIHEFTEEFTNSNPSEANLTILNPENPHVSAVTYQPVTTVT